MCTGTEIKELMRRFESAMNTRQLELLDEIISPNVVRHCEATPRVRVANLEQFKDFLRADASVFPDNKQTFEQIIVEDDWVGLWASYEGTQRGIMGQFPPSNKYVKFSFSRILRIEKRKIAEWWVTWDNMSILCQLGHLPA